MGIHYAGKAQNVREIISKSINLKCAYVWLQSRNILSLKPPKNSCFKGWNFRKKQIANVKDQNKWETLSAR